MTRWATFVVVHRWWVVAVWVAVATAGVFAAPKATAALSYDFGLPGQPGYEANQQIVAEFGSGGDNAPVLLVIGDGRSTVDPADAGRVATAVRDATSRARVISFAEQAALLGRDGRTGMIMVYPRVDPGPDAYATALPTLESTP